MNNLFYENDKNGFIKNIFEDDINNQKKLSSFFNSIITIFQKYIEKENLISIFAKYKKYDDNTFKVKILILLNNHFNFDKNLQNDFNDLKNKFKIVKKCSLFFNTRNEVNSNLKNLFDLKINFICIYGNDIRKEIQNFKPTIDNINFNFQKLIEIFFNFEKIDMQDKLLAKSTIKIILGCCYELCIDREKKYSNNLEFFYKTFSKYYPEKEIFAKKLLELYNNSNYDIKFIEKILSTFGKWLILQYEKIIIEKKLLTN
ncbi:MAG: hypothetical protein KatS3mg068_2152 [Candidatus Sericytochromatia bacterium]|nr:MAG: hypothetical protein KatS3mg068_2152 [Candidatus Sericytochromatia bacterium]